ncbi:MAG: hypothetical protein DRP15_01515 [Candidatus Aenigmatarchaeota archaeon]|nr:MAG: hypothetical protein DRP15_01515 [Candidatus Aenigmarchaeota archaeon]
MNFHGYPDFSSRIFSEMGMSDEDVASFIESAKQSQNMNKEGCENVIKLLQENSDAMNSGDLPVYTNPETRRVIENESGAKVIQMYSVESGGKKYVLALLDNKKICSATENTLCSCFDYGSII